MLKILFNVFLVSMFSVNLFGATNKLLDPKTSVIVDVGYNNGTAHVNKPFPQSIQDIPALSRQIDNAIILKKRDKLTKSCTVDQYGSKACPEEMVDCTGTPITNPGSAIVHNASSYAAKIPVTSAGYVLNNGAGGYNWGANILTNYGTPVGNHTYSFYAAEAGTYTFNLMIDNYGTMSVDGTQILSANNWPTNYSATKTLAVGVHTININGANVDGPSGQAGTVVYNGSIIWNSRTGQPATTTYTCPSALYSDNGTNCRIDYTYSTYSCPVAPITEQAWIGPLTAGGDCGGIGVNAAKQCNSPTPPSGNCIQTNFSCPVGDEQNECVKTASTDSIAQNLFNGYKYAPGTATAHSNTISKPRLCAGQTLECSSLGQTYSVNPLNANECTSPLVLGDFQVSGYTQTNSNSLITNFGEKTYTSGKLAEKWNSTVGSWIDLSNPDNQHSSVNAPSTQHGHIEYDNGKLREVYDTLYGPWIDLSIATNQHSIISSKGHTEWEAGKLRERNSALSGTWIEICPNNQPLKAICETGSTYNSSSRICSNGFKPKWVCNLADANLSNNICDLSQNYKFNATLNKCYLDKTGQTEDFIQKIYVAQKNTGFNTTTDMCESPKTTSCSEPGYTFDPAIGECVGDYSCPGYWNATSGKCEVPPTVDCDPGYIYSKITKRCEIDPGCEFGGILDLANFICNKPSECDTGWSKDIGTGQCIKNIESLNPICTDLSAIWDSSTHICTNSCQTTSLVTIASIGGGQLSGSNFVTITKTVVLQPKESLYAVSNNDYAACDDDITTFSGTYSGYVSGSFSHSCPTNGITKDIATNNTNNPVTIQISIKQKHSGGGWDYSKIHLDQTICASSNEIPTCSLGYTYNKDKDNCYKELSGIQSDYDQGIYIKTPTCLFSTYNLETRDCTYLPKCFNNGIMDFSLNTCFKNEIITCNSGLIPIISNDISGYDMVCATSNVCPTGTTKIVFNGETYCKSTKSNTCPDGYTFDAPSNKCFAPTYCESGYKKEGNECKLNYNWSTYTCPTGWGDPLTAGADCHGECNSDGCWCNGSNAPANNCKQSLTVSNLSSTYELFEKRPIQKHFVTGDALSKKDFGELKNISCGQNCLFDVNKITGQGSDLCFEKSSNEKTCFTVNDCYFEGSIVNSNSDGSLSSIKKIDLLDPYSMGLVSTTSTTEIKGSVRLRYNANKGFDYSDGGTGGFSSWGDTWKSEGYSLARSAIKLSDGNWYVKATMPAGDSRACGFDSNFRTLPDSSYHVASYSSKCFAGAANIVNGCAMDITIDIPAGLSFIGYSDIESVASSEFMTAACNGDNKYDESFSVFNAIIPPAGAPVTRVGSGVQGSSSLNMVQLLCRTVYDPVTNTCAMSYENTILSSCRLNGHVGWSTRAEGITSINLGEGISRWLEIDSNGTANLNPTNAADQGGISKWEGFNIGLMLLQLSDGNYYVANSMKGDDGIEIDRKLPGSIKKLSNSNYQFAPLNPGETTPVCMYKGKNTPNMCGRSLKIILPEAKLYVLAIQDLESFNAVQIGGTKIIDNTFDLNMSINGNKYDYKGSGLFTPIEIVKEDTSVTDTTNTKFVKDRLKFWDSFIDGDIGFIEFTRDVRNKDRVDNFVPENQIPYNMSKVGFTSLDFIPSMGKTIFIKPTTTTASECSAFASSVGGSVITTSSVPVAMLKTIYSLGGENSQSCIIGNDKLDGFNSIEWAVRKNIYSGSFSYKCSPYICDEINQCEIDTCPKETLGTPPVLTEYIGTLLPPAYNEPGCREQKCDGKKPFIEFCGRQGSCNASQNSFTDASGHCFELYCNQGNLNVNKKTCEVMSCPQGTVPTTGGMCSR